MPWSSWPQHLANKTAASAPEGGFSELLVLGASYLPRFQPTPLKGKTVGREASAERAGAKGEAGSCRTHGSALGGAIRSRTQREPRPEISTPPALQSPRLRRSKLEENLRDYSERVLWEQLMRENAGSPGENAIPPTSAQSQPRELSLASRWQLSHPLREEPGGGLRNKR